MNQILITILNDTYTISDLRHKLATLKSFLSQTIFKSSQKEFDAEDLAWVKSLPDGVLANFNKDNLTQQFAAFEKEINSFKVLTVYLTFEPDNNTIAQLGAYLRKTFPNISLMDIKYDPKLIAGTAFVWNGVYKDYSMHALLEQKKGMILENLKKFLR